MHGIYLRGGDGCVPPTPPLVAPLEERRWELLWEGEGEADLGRTGGEAPVDVGDAEPGLVPPRGASAIGTPFLLLL